MEASWRFVDATVPREVESFFQVRKRWMSACQLIDYRDIRRRLGKTNAFYKM